MFLEFFANQVYVTLYLGSTDLCGLVKFHITVMIQNRPIKSSSTEVCAPKGKSLMNCALVTHAQGKTNHTQSHQVRISSYQFIIVIIANDNRCAYSLCILLF